jgi:quercetin dioxygenase-like cupin family protein
VRTCIFWTLFVALSLTTAAHAQEPAHGHSRPFVTSPALPDCATINVVDGNPATEPSITMINIIKDCVIPWHWHTARERLIIVEGTGVVEMKGGRTLNVVPGEFVMMVAKKIYRFTATSEVTLYSIPDGPFDIHYVDADGKEIATAEATKK